MREDMIGCRVEVDSQGPGRLVCWAPPLAVVCLDSGEFTQASFSRLRALPGEVPGLARMRTNLDQWPGADADESGPVRHEVGKKESEIATLRARNQELVEQLAQHAADRPRWPKWEELTEADQAAALDLLEDAVGEYVWVEEGTMCRTHPTSGHPGPDAWLTRLKDDRAEVKRVLTQLLLGLAERETER